MDVGTFEVPSSKCKHVRALYMANYSLAQFFVGLIFVGNAHPRKLNSHEDFCVYSIQYYVVNRLLAEGVDLTLQTICDYEQENMEHGCHVGGYPDGSFYGGSVDS